MTLEEAQRAKARHEAALLRKPNVVGVGVGKKVVAGEETDELCVVVFVRKKVSEADLRAGERVPNRINQVSTDVVETGDLVAQTLVAPTALTAPTLRHRPAPGGVSMGHFRVTAGTLGCPVWRGSEMYILSNAHILADTNHGKREDPILQPAPLDGGVDPEDVIAHLGDFVPLQWERRGFFQFLSIVFPRRNRVDAALGRPIRQEDVADGILGIGPVEGTAEATLDLRVQKSGRTTGHTRGKVTHVDATVTVAYGTGRRALFEDQILTTKLSEGGDSGSVVLDEERRAVGLLFGGSQTVSVLNRFEEVLSALAVQL